MRKCIENKQFDEERALYNLQNADVLDCIFAGEADGESVLKESRDINLKNCSFSLRYPLWHVDCFNSENITMDELTRAAIWYSRHGVITDSVLGGIKAVRECEDIELRNCRVNSQEFGWKSRDIRLLDTEIISEYLFFDSSDVTLHNVKMKGKYSFQYMGNLEITDSVLDTKDAFWHSKNVTVRNSVVKGEYLGWFSEGLTLIDCEITGTQPLCYCERLKLVNCTMKDTDLAFEYSDVEADVRGHIISVKNPKSGLIMADSVGEVINEAPVMECTGRVVTYNFYGWECADVPAITDKYNNIKTPRDLYDALSDLWCVETCAPRMRDDWTPENKTLGQCSITAFLVQDIFGGKVYGILRPGGNYHCYNVIGDCVFDLTSEQFGDEVLVYENNPEQFREVHFAKEEKRLRYEHLKEELRRHSLN